MSTHLILLLAAVVFLVWDYYREYSTGNSIIFSHFPNLFNQTGGYASNVG